MRRQVPQYVDIGLEQAQVHPGAADVIHLAQLLALDQAADGSDGRVELEGVADHGSEAQALGGLGDFNGLGHAGGDGFFDQDVLAGLQSPPAPVHDGWTPAWQ